MSTYREGIYGMLESIAGEDYVIGMYTVHVETADFMKHAGELALQESTGSWVLLPLETRELVARHGAMVISAFEMPDYEYDQPDGKRSFVYVIAFPIINFGHQLPMLINIVIGVVSYFGDIKLVDLVLPESFVKAFPEP